MPDRAVQSMATDQQSASKENPTRLPNLTKRKIGWLVFILCVVAALISAFEILKYTHVTIERNYPSGKHRYQVERFPYWLDGKEIQNGVHLSWYPTGEIYSESHWTDGKQDGIAISWYKNGKKRTENHWREGNMKGMQSKWNEKGELVYQVEY